MKPEHSTPDWAQEFYQVSKRKFQVFLDRIATRAKERWAFFFLVLGFFVLRIYIKQGYAVIAYLLGLFYLNNVMLYLAPAEDPEETEISDFELPTRENDEYKGFQRKMQEMEFWKQVTFGTVLAAVLSCFQCTDIEIHWPLLLTYFIFMTLFLCRFKLEHMFRYKYVPFEFGKKKYSKQEAQEPKF